MSLDSLLPFLQLALNQRLGFTSLFPRFSSDARIDGTRDVPTIMPIQTNLKRIR